MSNQANEAQVIDFDAMSPDQKNAMLLAAEKYKKEQESKKKADREAYAKLKDETVREKFAELSQISEKMLQTKAAIFQGFDTIIDMKDELYTVKSDRNSDTFTTSDGSISIKLGNRTNEGWADEHEIGISKVKEFLKTLAKDANSAMLVDTVMGLLAKDRKGNLKASKVLELEKLATESGDPSFLEGIKIIKDAYRPQVSCQFIEVRYRDENDKEQSLPLSMSAIEVKE